MPDTHSALKYLLSKLVLLPAFLGLLAVTSEIAQTQTETVLYSFCSMPSCADGAEPDSGLILDASGFLYGETRDGGKHRYGTVFMASVNGGKAYFTAFWMAKVLTLGTACFGIRKAISMAQLPVRISGTPNTLA